MTPDTRAGMVEYEDTSPGRVWHYIYMLFPGAFGIESGRNTLKTLLYSAETRLIPKKEFWSPGYIFVADLFGVNLERLRNGTFRFSMPESSSRWNLAIKFGLGSKPEEQILGFNWSGANGKRNSDLLSVTFWDEPVDEVTSQRLIYKKPVTYTSGNGKNKLSFSWLGFPAEGVGHSMDIPVVISPHFPPLGDYRRIR